MPRDPQDRQGAPTLTPHPRGFVAQQKRTQRVQFIGEQGRESTRRRPETRRMVVVVSVAANVVPQCLDFDLGRMAQAPPVPHGSGPPQKAKRRERQGRSIVSEARRPQTGCENGR